MGGGGCEGGAGGSGERAGAVPNTIIQEYIPGTESMLNGQRVN